MNVIEEIAAERNRQSEGNHWTTAHDDAHKNGQLAGAAACYTLQGLKISNMRLGGMVTDLVRDLWPWAQHYWRPETNRENLVRAAALIVAEIERLDRKHPT